MKTSNQPCTGWAFVLNGSNPVSFGSMSGGDSRAVSWLVNSSGPVSSEWDVWVDFDYNGSYKSNSTKARQPFKVRIVNYPWRDRLCPTNIFLTIPNQHSLLRVLKN